jgi:elongation factor Ts
MDIKATDVKKLREKTGAGMMDCKKALVEAKGDFAKAEKLLKELGLAAADKRSERATNEGRVFSKIDNNKGILLELSCETDFVSRNQEFVSLGESLIEMIMKDNIQDQTEALDEKVKDTASRIKENMGLRRFQLIEAGDGEYLKDYIHGEGRIGVIVKLKSSDPKAMAHEKFKQTAFDFTLHIAAFAPLYLSRDKVDKAYIEEQEDLFRKQTANDPKLSGKPDKVVESIVKGKLNKHLATVCLLDQGFVRDEKIKSSKVLDDLGKEIGAKVEIKDFLYFRVGA